MKVKPKHKQTYTQAHILTTHNELFQVLYGSTNKMQIDFQKGSDRSKITSY